MKHILMIASHGPSLVNFRLDLIKKLISKGYKVSVACPKEKFSENLQKKLIKLGVDINFFCLSRHSLNIIDNFKSIIKIYKIIKNLKPKIIISYTIKPVVYTGLILKLFNEIKYYPLITGLGYVFSKRNSIKHKILRYLIIYLYSQSLKKGEKIIFQNNDDISLFIKLRILKNKNLACVVNGSGVNLSFYPRFSLPSEPIFLMISRLLIEKGVREYVQAAKIVHKDYPNAKFQLAGGLEQNPLSISINELQEWINSGAIQYLGQLQSVQSALKSCKYFVLPSYYREGTPRSILEALATGRPIITTDTPGCRETVVNEKNGLFIPTRDPKALADAMVKLLKKKDEFIKKMADESYLIAKNKYDVNKVNQIMLDFMGL